MKETYVSNCERAFINKAAIKSTRLDGRGLLEPRKVQLNFGNNWGCCLASLGKTKVAAQVSCDIIAPKTSRPNEGLLHINVELSSLAAPYFESNRPSETSALITRLLEKCFKDSKCVDLEALCIVAAKKVWNVRVDLNVVNHDGNLIDCAAIAALAALMHFHRPDVTSTGDEIIIHPFIEKDPIPLTIYHHPVCISFITFENGVTVFDPTYNEERVGAAMLSLSINAYREICSLYFDYISYTPTVSDVVDQVSNFAANYASELIKLIKDAVKQDTDFKYKKETPKINSLVHSINPNDITTMRSGELSVKLSTWKSRNEKEEDNINMDLGEDSAAKIVQIGEGTAELLMKQGQNYGEGGQNTWFTGDTSSEESDSGLAIIHK